MASSPHPERDHVTAARRRLGHLAGLTRRAVDSEARIRDAAEKQRDAADADLNRLRPRVHLDDGAADEYQRLTLERGKLDTIAARSRQILGDQRK